MVRYVCGYREIIVLFFLNEWRLSIAQPVFNHLSGNNKLIVSDSLDATLVCLQVELLFVLQRVLLQVEVFREHVLPRLLIPFDVVHDTVMVNL